MTRRVGRSGINAGGRKSITAAVAAVLVLGAASTTLPTQAAWTDAVHVAAPVTAGTWTTQPPSTPANSVIVPDDPTTSLTNISWDITPEPGNLNFCVAVTIRGATAQPAPWELRADLDKPPFNGMAAKDVYYSGSTQVTLRTAQGDSSILVITGKGNPSDPWNPEWNNVLLDSSRSLVVRLCAGSAPIPPVGDPAWYTTSVTRGEWTPAKACKVLTVKGRVTDLQANPFYFTWVATMDLADAKQRILDAGRTINYLQWSPDPSNGYQFTVSPGTTNPVRDSYALTGGRMMAIRGTGQTTVTACVIAN